MLSQDVLNSVKKVRSHTALGEGTVSIAHMAIDLAKRVFQELSERSFVFVGAGEMIRLASLYAASYSPKSMSFVNRTLDRAATLRDEIGSGSIAPLSELPELLLKCDVVITCTGSTEPIITKAILQNTMRGRRGRSLFIVDIALPRDVERSCAQLEDVYLFELDDLREVVNTELGKRLAEVSQAKKILSYGIARHQGKHQWDRDLGKKVQALGDHTSQIIQKEAERTLKRPIFDSLTEEQRVAMDRMFQAVSARMSSHVARSLKQIDNQEERTIVAESLGKLFPPKTLHHRSKDLQ